MKTHPMPPLISALPANPHLSLASRSRVAEANQRAMDANYARIRQQSYDDYVNGRALWKVASKVPLATGLLLLAGSLSSFV